MTILPTKKAQEGKNGDAEFEDGRTNRGTRVRGSRDRTRAAPSSDVNANSDCSTATSINSPNSRFEYTSEVEKRENPDCGSIPYKRTRHRSAPSAKLSLSGMDCRGTMTRRHSNEDDTEEGYNSSDEHGPYEADPDIAKKEELFEVQLKERRGFIIKKMVPDGACLFRAVADQVYGDQEMHSIVRNHCMDYMLKNADYFSKFVTEDFDSYIRRKKNDYCHGNNVEMQALSEMYNRPIEVFVYSTEPINTFLCQSHHNPEENPPIRLSYHGNVHYNSIINPYAPAVGVGLGLAGYKPVVGPTY